MVVYWSMLGWVCSLTIFRSLIYSVQKVTQINNKKDNVSIVFAILVFSYLILIIGLRSGIADTTAYINLFKLLPSDISYMSEYMKTVTKDRGFTFLSILFKCYISKDPQIWLMTIAFISCWGLLRTFKKYSISFNYSVFFLITTCIFNWMLNGMRQFLVVSIIFAFSDLIVKRKTFKFILLVLLLSQIHGSVLIWIPIYFVVTSKPWDKRMLIFLVVIVFATFMTSTFTSVLDNLLADTSYNYVVDQFSQDDGASFIRVILAGIPIVFAFIKRKQIENIGNPILNISVNASIVSMAFYLLATTTSGIFIGRIPIYFEIYNLILLPWLLCKLFKGKTKFLINMFFVLFYILHFYLLMDVFGQSYYISDVLKLSL